MIAPWMLYSILLGALASAAALLAERTLRLWRRQARIVWGIAIAATVAGPPLAYLASSVAAPVTLPAVTVTGLAPSIQSAVSGPATAAIRRGAARLDVPLAAAWGALSLLLAITLLRSQLVLGRRRRQWRAEVVDGTRVLVAPNIGPAVVGVREPTVVIPSWVLDFDASLRALVLRHETEHIRARDPYVLLAGLAAVVIAPWNPALWWQLRRLRLAVEMDCDARVLGWSRDAERYGLLLLAVGQRGAIPIGELTAALSEPSSLLERRIVAMRARLPRFRLLQGASLAVVTAGIVALACEAPHPTSPKATPQQPNFAQIAQKTGAYFEFQVEQPVRMAAGSPAPRYPDKYRLAGVEGEVLAQFIVDTTGRADMSTFKVLKTSHDDFTAAVQNALPQMRFIPAEIGGRKVKQVVQEPFTFAISKESAKAAMPSRAPGATSPELTGVPGPVRMPAVAPPATKPAAGYVEFKLENPATQAPMSGAPRYPDALRAAGIEGEVLAQFVVDTTGIPIVSTYKVLRSSHDLFTQAVREALPDMRFTPAQVGGRKVKQLLQQPFTFSLAK